MRLRRNTITRRASGNLTGQIRCVLLDEYGAVHGKTTYPSKQAAELCRPHPAYGIEKCLITGRGGPFSDTIEVFRPCQSRVITGSPCGWEGPRSWSVTVEHLPEHARHKAPSPYPGNGGRRLRVCKACAKKLQDEYTKVVEE